jgi:hypothetical protein
MRCEKAVAAYTKHTLHTLRASRIDFPMLGAATVALRWRKKITYPRVGFANTSLHVGGLFFVCSPTRGHSK